MNIVGKRNIYFLISLLIMIPGIISLILFGLRLSIDFTGGSRFQYQINSESSPRGEAGKIQNSELQKVINNQGVEVGSVQQAGKNVYLIRTKPLSEATHQKIKKALQNKFVGKELSFETVGPTVGAEITRNAILSVFFASLAIVLYIAWSFRSVPKPASSWRFGICAIIALLHDAVVVLGIFSILGYLFHVEVDSLFVTALLTIIGFSVHDTIVVFDRIRENLRRMPSASFSEVVNASILQTLGRSINTSLTVILVLFTLYLFGGESIRWFVVALLIGIISGTYSSIFNAAPLLVVWQEWSDKKIARRK